MFHGGNFYITSVSFYLVQRSTFISQLVTLPKGLCYEKMGVPSHESFEVLTERKTGMCDTGTNFWLWYCRVHAMTMKNVFITIEFSFLSISQFAVHIAAGVAARAVEVQWHA